MNLKNTYLFTFYILLSIGSISGSMLIDGCKSKTNSNSSYTLTGDTIADGKTWFS